MKQYFLHFFLFSKMNLYRHDVPEHSLKFNPASMLTIQIYQTHLFVKKKGYLYSILDFYTITIEAGCSLIQKYKIGSRIIENESVT